MLLLLPLLQPLLLPLLLLLWLLLGAAAACCFLVATRCSLLAACSFLLLLLLPLLDRRRRFRTGWGIGTPGNCWQSQPTVQNAIQLSASLSQLPWALAPWPARGVVAESLAPNMLLAGTRRAKEIARAREDGRGKRRAAGCLRRFRHSRRRKTR